MSSLDRTSDVQIKCETFKHLIIQLIHNVGTLFKLSMEVPRTDTIFSS